MQSRLLPDARMVRAFDAQKELEALNGKCGGVIDSGEFFMSNDEGWERTTAMLEEQYGKGPRFGLGMFIGSGGVLSLLPSVRVEAATTIDRCDRVTQMTKLMARLIMSRDRPDEVIDRLEELARHGDELVLDQFGNLSRSDIYVANNQLQREQDSFGEYHWSNPSRFEQVKQALAECPIAFVSGDIRNANLALQMSSVAIRYGLPLTFANMTNVHQWIKPYGVGLVDNLPFSPQHTIVYSEHTVHYDGSNSHYPYAQIVSSRQQYIERANADVYDLSAFLGHDYES